MNVFATTFLLICVIAFLMLPRRWAPLPLLMGACYITSNQMIEVGPFHFTVLRLRIAIEVGPFHFTVLRLIIAAGLARVLMRGERLAGELNGLDRVMLIGMGWMLVSSGFHEDPSATVINRFGLVYDACGTYFLLRIFCQSLDDVKNLCRLTAILLVPVAVEMLYEKLVLHNLFSELGGGLESPQIREGQIRAQGPFAHAILAGTVGAVCLPLIVGIWQQYRKTAVAGITACLVMVFSCASSGPIMSAIAAIGAMFLWRYHDQDRMRFIRWFAVVVYIALDLVMKDPAYFLIARIDLVGGSTGWHRSRLIQSAIEHLPEWWLAGTDYTRHWMPTGVSWSREHTDITNHYLQQGVLGGLPAMLLFIAMLYVGFSLVGKRLLQEDDLTLESRFIVWALGASLFVHAVTFISVSYFDQSSMFIDLTLAAIGSAYSSTITDQPIDISADI